MPNFDPKNLPRALFIALMMERIPAMDAVRHGLATHFVPEGTVDSLKAHLSLDVNQITRDSEIEQIIDSFASMKYTPGLERTLPYYDEMCHIFQPDAVESIICRAKES